MFARLRSRSSLASLLILALLLGLVVFVVIERRASNASDERIELINESEVSAIQLSLYVRYNAHDTSAYTLGHLEYRQEYTEHREAFVNTLENLQTYRNVGILDEDEGPILDRIKQTREEYDRASERLFAAADANRKNPSAENQAKEDSEWEAADELGDQLGTQSQQLASNINAEAKGVHSALERRNNLAILLTLGIGAAIAVLILLILRRVARAEEAQARFASIVENSRDAIDSKTFEGAILSVNPSAEQLYGYPEEEIKGKDISIFTPPEHLGEMKELLQRVGQGETISEYETERVSKEGRRIPLSLTISPVRDSGNEIVAVSAIARDITERKLAGQELRRAKEAAEEASQAKSEFLATMSHEIRTPMNGVIGMTGLLLDTDLDPEQQEYAETVRSSGENLLTIINDILDFSKIEAGKMDLELISFDLRAAVEESVGLLAERAHAKGLELASLVEYGVPVALEGDPGRIRQVLVNLLGNAVKFAEEGEVILRVGLVEETEDAAVVRFEVKDTGIGMTREQRERLFKSFSQVDASTTRKYGGTGLGLAISKRLVELMGGEIGVESEPGVGSTFFFILPLRKQEKDAPPAPKLLDLGGLRVLIVDDNETNRQIVHHQIISWGMKNGSAEDGLSALEMLRECATRGERYDLAILDMQMPEMDGLELARKIKADPLISSTKLIMLSSIGRRGEGEEARQASIDAYLTKPVRQSQLFDAIAIVMGTAAKEAVASEEEKERQLVTRHSLMEAKYRSQIRILVAEDNQVNQKVAVKMLEKLGYRADVAANGLEAVEALSRLPYSAVLMDVQMPEMDGYEATAEIRRRERSEKGPRTPIIAMTANAMQEDRERALEEGMDDYISKPVKPEVLGAVLERWIPREGAIPGPEVGEGAKITEDTEEVLDRAVVENLRELGGSEMISELMEMFFEDTASGLAALQAAIESGDAPTVERVAHTFKGSSGNMGATRMSAICAELEDAGASGDLRQAPGLLERLEVEYGRVRLALEAEREVDP